MTVTVTDGRTATRILCWCGAVFSAKGSPESVSREQAKWEEAHKGCTQERAYEPKTFWLSFCDSKRPAGQQFLGACIVDVSPYDVANAAIETFMRFPMAERGAEYIAAAVMKAHALGCNPGGEVASMEMPSDHPNMRHYTRGVLMDRAEIARIDDLINEGTK